MPDWTQSMTQTFEYYIVDPKTWKDSKRLTTVKSGTSITRDLDSATLGSATIDVVESIGECYVRIYLITIQNGVQERHPLGTYLVQSPSTSFDGKISSVSMDAYTPLIELKENPTPIGYSLFKGENIMDGAYRIIRERARAPVVQAVSTDTLPGDFVANTDDTWLSFLTDLIATARYTFGLDELGRIIFLPKQELESLQPVWTYTVNNTDSIILPEITVNHDIYDIPNVVEVVCNIDGDIYYSRVVNDDSNSPTSTINRGREKIHRVINPNVSTGIGFDPITDPEAIKKFQDEHGLTATGILDGKTVQALIVQKYAETLLKELSTIEFTVSYTHTYCPVRVGDCVRLNYPTAGLNNIKAKVISQNIKCKTGCQVSEKAVFTNKLWR